MIAPAGFEDMSDEELLEKLEETYGEDGARYALKVLRGEAPQFPKNPLK